MTLLTPPEAPVQTHVPKKRSKFGLRLLFACAVLGAIVVLSFRTSTPPRIQALPNGIVASRPSLIYRWIPPTWGTFWRLKETIFGRSQIIDIKTKVWDCSGLNSDHNFSPLGKPDFKDANGFQIWILGKTQLDNLQLRLKEAEEVKEVFAPSVRTGDKMQARVSMGSSVPIGGVLREVGFSADFLARVHSDRTDLSAVIAQTCLTTNDITHAISLRTNFAVAARMQIPKNSRVFILSTELQASNKSVIAMSISPTFPPPKK